MRPRRSRAASKSPWPKHMAKYSRPSKDVAVHWLQFRGSLRESGNFHYPPQTVEQQEQERGFIFKIRCAAVTDPSSGSLPQMPSGITFVAQGVQK